MRDAISRSSAWPVAMKKKRLPLIDCASEIACELFPLRAPPVIKEIFFIVVTSLYEACAMSRFESRLDSFPARAYLTSAHPVLGKPVKSRRCPATVREDEGPSTPPLTREGGPQD